MQQGSLAMVNRKDDPAVWQFRWSEKDRNGRRIYRKRVIGTVRQYPDAQTARDATAALLAHINAGSSENGACKINVEQIFKLLSPSTEIRSI